MKNGLFRFLAPPCGCVVVMIWNATLIVLTVMWDDVELDRYLDDVMTQGNTRVRVEFDVTRFADFQMDFADSQTTGSYHRHCRRCKIFFGICQ